MLTQSTPELSIFNDLDDQGEVAIEGAGEVIAPPAASIRSLGSAACADAFTELLFVGFYRGAVD